MNPQKDLLHLEDHHPQREILDPRLQGKKLRSLVLVLELDLDLLPEKTLDLDLVARKENPLDLVLDLLLEEKLSFTSAIFHMIPLKEKFRNYSRLSVRLILWPLSKDREDLRVLGL